MAISYNPSIVTNGLMACYDPGNIKSYSGSGSTLSDITGRYTATLFNSPIYHIFQNGGYFRYNGTNSYATISRPVEDDFTLACWFRTTQTGGTSDQWYNGYGLIDGEVGGVTNDFGLALGNGKVVFGSGNPDTSVASSSSYNDGIWHYAVGTRLKSSGSLSLYVDGVFVGSATGGTQSLTAPSQLRFGGRQSGGVFYNGEIGSVQIYNRVLTADEIRNNYNAFSPKYNVLGPVYSGMSLLLDAGNTASYPGSGSTWTDISGNGNNFTLVSSPTYNSSNGGTLSFNGTSYASNTTSGATLANAATTISAWFNTTTIAGGYQLIYGSSNQPKMYLQNAGTWLYQIGSTSSNVISANTWYNLAISSNSTSTLYYLNGVYFYSTNGNTWSTTINPTLKIAQDPSSAGQNFNGAIGSVTVYNRVLSSSEILQNCNAYRGRYGV